MRDREYLQALIDASDEVTIPRINPATGRSLYLLDAPLVLHSHSHVTLDGCTLQLADHVYSNLFITKGAWSGETAHGGDGAVPEKTVDISIVGKNGATLDGGNPNDLREKTANTDGRPGVLHNTFVLFRYVDGFSVRNLRVTNPRYWGLTFYFCANGEIADIDFTAANNVPNQDGIDLRIGCHDITIERITGSTGDDSVALTALGGRSDLLFDIPGESRDIHDVTIRDVSTEVTGGHGIIRLLNHDGILLYNVTIENVYDRLIDTGRTKCIAAIRLGDVNYYSVRRAEEGEMHDVTVNGLTTNAREAIKIAVPIPGYRAENVDWRQ